MDATDYTRPTVESVLDEFAERNLIERDASGVTPTLVTRLIWDTYQLVDSYLASIAAPDSDAPRWPTAADRRVVLELLADRRDVLKCIEPAPGDIRALVDTLDASRSTVTRAIRELSVAGLVERTADGYTISPTGHQAIKQYCTSLKTIADILVAQDILGELPLKCSIKPTLLANADVADTADSPPYRLPAGVLSRIAAADRMHLCLPVLSTTLLLDTCQHQVVREGMALKLLMPPALFETLTTDFPGKLAAMADANTGSCAVYVADSLPPFGLVLAEINEQMTVSVICYSEHQTIQGVIHNSTPTAVTWAEDCYMRAGDGSYEASAGHRFHHQITVS